MRKTTLNAAKLKESLQELAQLGSPVDLSAAGAEFEPERVEIEQVGGIHDSRIFELQDGRIAFMADIAVTNQSTRAIDVVDIELRTDWGSSYWEWLTPRWVRSQGHAKRDVGYKMYQFPGEGGLELEYDQVINQVLLERRRLPGKLRLQGWLLGVGGSMPTRLRHGQWLDLSLAIIGSDREYTTPIRLWTERLEARPKMASQRTGLFGPARKDAAMPSRHVGGTRWATHESGPRSGQGYSPRASARQPISGGGSDQSRSSSD
jgi:hypothetical protein